MLKPPEHRSPLMLLEAANSIRDVDDESNPNVQAQARHVDSTLRLSQTDNQACLTMPSAAEGKQKLSSALSA